MYAQIVAIRLSAGDQRLYAESRSRPRDGRSDLNYQSFHGADTSRAEDDLRSAEGEFFDAAKDFQLVGCANSIARPNLRDLQRDRVCEPYALVLPVVNTRAIG